MGVLFEKIYKKLSKLIFGDINTIIIEHLYDNENYEINNKLLIDAILHGCDKGGCYLINNKSIKKDANKYIQEKNRKIFFKKEDEFMDNGIHVWYGRYERTENVKDKGEKKVMYKEKITLKSRKSTEDITAYIYRKRDEYIKEMYLETNQLYVYDPAYYQYYLEYTKIKFGSAKTFDNWFSPNKELLEQTVDNFINRKGIYSLKSTQQKMVILLHGEPGCGKSSFIKALANKLDRHLFPASLDKFTSVCSFKRYFYNETVVTVENNRGKYDYVPLNKRIYVFEEIDTAGPIVMDREKLRKNTSLLKNCGSYMSKKSDLHKTKSKNVLKKRKNALILDKMIAEFKIKRNKKEAELKEAKKSEREIVEELKALDKEFESELQLKKMELDEGMGEDIDNDEEDSIFDQMQKESPLNLGDILTVLDGIAELKDFVCVITTNHRNYLDPALVRPGRITLELELGRMNAPEICKMLNYYYITHNCFNEDIALKTKMQMISQIAMHWDGKHKPSKIETVCQQNSLQKLYKIYKTVQN